MNPLSKSKISDIATSYAGGTPKRTVAGYYNGTIPWVKSGEINSVNIFSSEEKITDEGLRNSSAKLVEPGAILVAMYGATAGKVGRLHIEATTNQAVLSVRSKNSNVISNDYLFWLLTFASEELIKQCQGAAQPNLSKQLIDGYQILYPSITEQQKIAEVLSTADKKIDLIDQKIAETEKLKTGLMQKLFSEGVGVQDENGNWQPHTEFQDSPFGKIPKSWSVETLGEHTIKVGSGVTPKGGSKAYVDTGIPLIRSQNVLFGKFKLDDVAFITEQQHEKMKGSQLEPKDVLLNITGASIGRCAVLPADFEEGNVNQHVCIIRMSQTITPEFCGWFLNSNLGQKQIWNLQAGGNREGLNFQQIRSFRIPVLTIEEQCSIVEILSTVSDKLNLLEQQKAETQQLKKGLMQKLLTGELRVPVEETEAA
ncbi:restriction endonuclease subunit S [Vibrio parahaemolyticus]|nr:restriction endonuclease subunit S [Vibrio parahaemolyticus]EIV8634895.1 restriction endonuclease subunit S [Vibrio parahaemolyticus]EIV8637098.1 restriction endonuclease subunit S [Vibrio parahaemolyticus]EJF4458341.1 restriction endonuclease subunit S [Vibrio parahaemolyticus]EKL0055189.1 restriction endonuclease subunit S [Vibrio parahaemolyticus]